MKELEEINEKKAKEILRKLEKLIISREEMHNLKKQALELKKSSRTIYSEAEKIKHKIEEIKVPSLESLSED
jgi:hypothetical protein